MGRLSPARRVALRLVGERRRRNARIRELARSSEALNALGTADRALAFRLALGAIASEQVLDSLIDGFVKRPSSLEPKVRDALRLSAYEICYLDTPVAVAASQGVELVRSVAPRATGMANAVLRRLSRETRPRVAAAFERVVAGSASSEELSLASGLPQWLVERVCDERGLASATTLCRAQREPAPVYVATNARRHDASWLEGHLAAEGMQPCAVDGLPGSFVLASGAELATSGLVDDAVLVVADVSSQVVCRLAASEDPSPLLEIGQGRGTKSMLLASATGAVWPSRIESVDSVAYKVRLSQRRMAAAGLAEVVRCHELDGCRLASDDVPPELAGPFDAVLLDAPCSGTGTLRRHPEIVSTLAGEDLAGLASLQGKLLAAAAARVAPGGVITYATCSVLRAEDEDVVAGFLATELGSHFVPESVAEAPAFRQSDAFAQLVGQSMTSEGFFLASPAADGGDGHFCARLRRREA